MSAMPLRYGENPHQQAAFYVEPGVQPGLRRHRRGAARQGAVVQQHPRSRQRPEPGPRVRPSRPPSSSSTTTPAAPRVGATLAEAFRKAYEGDPLSAYGGVLAFNREVDEATAMQITEPNRFIECIIAPASATRRSTC